MEHSEVPHKYMTVGEVAKKMGVSVRTLQYYDREGILCPSAVSEGGRRLYSDKDVVRLHQVLSLKSLGFSLGEIRTKLVAVDTPGEAARSRAGRCRRRSMFSRARLRISARCARRSCKCSRSISESMRISLSICR